MTASRIALIVDDAANLRRTLRVCLEAEGARVVEAADGGAALVALNREPIDVVFLDLRLGSASGLDLIPTLRAALPRAPIVVITAHANTGAIAEARERGARAILPEPFAPAHVRAAPALATLESR